MSTTTMTPDDDDHDDDNDDDDYDDDADGRQTRRRATTSKTFSFTAAAARARFTAPNQRCPEVGLGIPKPTPRSRNSKRTSGHLKVEILNRPLDTSKSKF